MAKSKISVQQMKERILKFIQEFPKDATSWAKATDELANLHDKMDKIYNENRSRKSKEYSFDWEKISKIPSEYNIRHRGGIENLLNLMPQHQIKEVYEYYDDCWFDPALQNIVLVKPEKSSVAFTDLQKELLINALDKHWNERGSSSHWEGIKMAKRVIRNL